MGIPAYPKIAVLVGEMTVNRWILGILLSDKAMFVSSSWCRFPHDFCLVLLMYRVSGTVDMRRPRSDFLLKLPSTKDWLKGNSEGKFAGTSVADSGATSASLLYPSPSQQRLQNSYFRAQKRVVWHNNIEDAMHAWNFEQGSVWKLNETCFCWISGIDLREFLNLPNEPSTRHRYPGRGRMCLPKATKLNSWRVTCWRNLVSTRPPHPIHPHPTCGDQERPHPLHPSPDADCFNLCIWPAYSYCREKEESNNERDLIALTTLNIT